MRSESALVALFASVVGTGCKDTECGDGTIERDGRCEPSSLTTSAGTCGPFTELQGDRCVPQFPPTVCDPSTTMPSEDPETGVTTCIGTGGGGCNAPFACPTPTEANRLTICGQLYDFETNAKLQGTDASGAACDPAMPATSGPCALAMNAFDAVSFATNPATASPLPNEGIYIDDCGRYRFTNIDTNGTSPFIGLGIDDAGMQNGPAGTTVTVGVATPKTSPVVRDFEAYTVKAATVQGWTTSGGTGAPSLAEGFYVASYRRHKLAAGVDRHARQDGVQFAKSDAPLTDLGEDWYFTASSVDHMTLDPALGVTGMSGTVLVENRSVAEGAAFGGIGGLGTGCEWEPHVAANIPGVVFIQLYRKVDMTPGSCAD